MNESHFLQIILAFIIANLMIVLLLPGAYSLPKNLLDQLWLYYNKEKPKGKFNKDKDKSVIFYFFAADLLVFNSVTYSISAILVAIITIPIQLNMWLPRLALLTLGPLTVYFVVMVLAFIKIMKRPKEPKWTAGCCYVTGLFVFMLIHLVVSVFFILNYCLMQLLFLMSIVSILYIASWLIPHWHYMPLTNLQTLRNLIKDKANKEQ